MDLTKILTTIFGPVIDFLKQNNLWTTAVSVYDGLSTIVGVFWGWLDKNANASQWTGYIVPFVKFIINIFLTLLDVLTKIGTWVLGLFK